MRSPGFLLFGGTNDRALLALCRGFEQYQVPYGLIGRNSDDLLRRSRYADHYYIERNTEELTLEQIKRAVAEGNSRTGERPWVICPTSEYVNLKIFTWHHELAAIEVSVGTCAQSLYGELSEKSSFRSFCENIGVPPPRILDKVSGQDATLPFVAKPRTNLSRSGKILYPHLVRSEEDRERFLLNSDQEEYYLEEFVLGESWYLLFYFPKNGPVAQGAQRNYLQQGLGKSIVLARAEPYPEQDVPQRFIDQLKQVDYRGFIMVEIRRTLAGDAISIEANPRCWGPFQLTMDGGMGLFETFLTDHGHPVDLPSRGPNGSNYCWTGGISQAIRSGKGLDTHVNKAKVASQFTRAIWNDVYARRDSWSCFWADLKRK